MASPKTLERREDDTELNPRVQMLTAGPTSTEALAKGKVLSTNRKHRLGIERTSLTRAQRLEIKRIRDKRRLTGKDPVRPPSWAEYKKPTHDVRDIAEMLATVEESDDGGCSNPAGSGSDAVADDNRPHDQSEAGHDPTPDQ